MITFMKKNLRYILAILCFAGMWISCSDDGGNDGEEPLTAPEVSVQNLSLKDAILPGRTVRLRANIINTTEAGLQWFVDGKEVSTDTIFEFSSVKEGAFRIKVTAFNRLGTASDSLDIQVMDGFKISDITNWTGSGENQSMLAIQWITGEVENWSNPEDRDVFFRAWGYRWEKANPPTGHDMIVDIAKKDPRLFIIVASDDNLGMTIRGFGYDIDGDGIEIQSEDLEYGDRTLKGIHLTEADFKDGIYEQKEADVNMDGFNVISGGDYWIGGWYVVYPSYWLGSGVAVLESKEYEYSGLYAGNRLLENEEWHTWTFSPINNAEKNILPIPRLLKAAPNN